MKDDDVFEKFWFSRSPAVRAAILFAAGLLVGGVLF